MRGPICRRALGALLVSWCAVVAVRAADSQETIEIPIVGRPSDLPFSEAAVQGQGFTVSTTAEPRVLQVEQPLLFTLRVQTEGRVLLPPQRLDLTQVPEFNDNFYIEDPKQDTFDPAAQTWKFVYRLKPQRLNVTEIPGVPFVYYRPDLGLGSKGFQTPYTEVLPLRVTDAEQFKAQRPVPDLFLHIETGDALLAHQEPWSPPRWWSVAALLVATQLGCTAWYLIWRRLYPDARRLTQQRRSRAAQLALRQLQRLPRGATEERAAYIAAAVTTYLRQRLDLPAAEPTPAEAAAHLRSAGCSVALTKCAEQFFQTCDAARFYPNAEAVDLPASARQLILDVEAHTWASVPS